MLYLTADGGGSKLLTILFDENFKPVSKGVADGTNENFISIDNVTKNMDTALGQCLGSDYPEIQAANFVIVGPKDLFIDRIKKKSKLVKATVLNEGQAALMAGCGSKYGMLALSGTGSDVFIHGESFNDAIGGWGTVLGDEGSGYDIGVATLRAAIYSEDGRGEKSIIPKLLISENGLKSINGLIPLVYGAKDQRKLIASVSKITSAAANSGDKTARDIYIKAGHDMSYMAITLLKKHGGNPEGPVVIAGGAWKGHESMFETFKNDINMEYPDINVIKPVFEPVMGGVVYQALENGLNKDEFWELLKTNFNEYRYR